MPRSTSDKGRKAADTAPLAEVEGGAEDAPNPTAEKPVEADESAERFAEPATAPAVPEAPPIEEAVPEPEAADEWVSPVHDAQAHIARVHLAHQHQLLQSTDEAPAALVALWRPLRWVLLAALVLSVVITLLSTFNRTMETTIVGASQNGSGTSTGDVVPAQPGQKVRVLMQGLNLRTQPSTGGGVIIRKLPKGMLLDLLAKKPGWFQVRTQDGTKGWVIQRYKGVDYSQLAED